MKRYIRALATGLLAGTLCLSALSPALAAGPPEESQAAAYLREQGIMLGDQNGNMDLESNLTRAQLATILTRLNGNPAHVEADRAFYTGQCRFSDVPAWAQMYVGFCFTNGYMAGYGNGLFGSNDPVTPAAACTVILRYLDIQDVVWDYSTACQTALALELTTAAAVSKKEISRGDLAVMLYRALGNTGFEGADSEDPPDGTLSRNADGSIALPSDGSQYVPQAGDVIRCDDGSNYTITDVARYDKNMFASGPLGPLPSATCDWNLLPQPELPAAEVRRFRLESGDYLFVRNLYETRRMLYTLYNAIGDNPETWQNGAPVPHPSGNPKVMISLVIEDGLSSQSFWPWRESEIVNLFNSCPPGVYTMECWDVYKDGVFQKTEYKIRVTQ